MSENTNDIIRSQYTNIADSSIVSLGNLEKSEKKHDTEIETINKAIYQENLSKENRNYLNATEQDIEPGYDLIDGIVNTPSNTDMIDGLVDSEEEIKELESEKEYKNVATFSKNSDERHSVIEALEQKKEIVAQRELERSIKDQELKQTQDQGVNR